MEMRCYRKTLRISYKDNVTNEEVRATIQQAIGPHDDLLTMVKRRKLQWCCHVSRSSGLANNTIYLARHREKGKKTKQRNSCKDNIREWTGLDYAKCQGAVEDRENGGHWLRNHLWCPNDPRG